MPMAIDSPALFKLITQLDGTTPKFRLVREFVESQKPHGETKTEQREDEHIKKKQIC